MKTIIEQTRIGKRRTVKVLASGDSHAVGYRLIRDQETKQEYYAGRVMVDVDQHTTLSVLLDLETIEHLYNAISKT